MRKGDSLQIGIGQKPHGPSSGAGGTFVVTKKSNGTFALLVVAGGAGGNCHRKESYCDAQLEEFGNGPSGQNNMDIGSSSKSGDIKYYNGGAGYQSDPPGATADHPRCFASGLIGGRRNGDYNGGFGGGGSMICNYIYSSAGGGGYTGGNGSTDEGPAGGGGSFCADKNGKKELGWYGAGKCIIRYVSKQRRL